MARWPGGVAKPKKKRPMTEKQIERAIKKSDLVRAKARASFARMRDVADRAYKRRLDTLLGLENRFYRDHTRSHDALLKLRAKAAAK